MKTFLADDFVVVEYMCISDHGFNHTIQHLSFLFICDTWTTETISCKMYIHNEEWHKNIDPIMFISTYFLNFQKR